MCSEADKMGSLISRTAQKRKIREKRKQKPSSSEETVQAIVHEGSPGERSKTTGGMLLNYISCFHALKCRYLLFAVFW